MEDRPAIDMDEVMEVMDDDEELLRECFDDFLKSMPEAINRIKASVVEDDASELDESAHKLKGTLRYLAANQAAEVAYQLEAMGKKNNLSNADEMLNNLEKECEKVKTFITKYCS